MKRFIHRAAIIAALFALHSYAPPLGAQPVTTSMQVQFEGTVYVPLDDGFSFDEVILTGTVHVVTTVIPPDPVFPPNPCRIRINLDQVSGVGDMTGLRYNAAGANRLNLPAIPSDAINLGFNLVPAGPPTTPPDPVIPLDH